MPFGKSLSLRYMTFESPKERETRDRDRSLRGKARIRARRAAGMRTTEARTETR